MVNAAEKQRYGGLMTEHERRVNDNDIKAYEVGDTNNIHGKLPGFGGAHEAERMQRAVERSLGGLGPGASPGKAEVVIGGGVKRFGIALFHVCVVELPSLQNNN